MNKTIGFAFSLALMLSGSSLAHGSHGSHGGLAGAALNSVEAFKHSAVIYDQFMSSSEERNNFVLAGNVVVLVAHIYQAFVQAVGHHHVRGKGIVALAAANAMTLMDLIVDLDTSWEYWGKDFSVAKVAANLVAPVCTALNLYSLYSLYRPLDAR